MTTAKRVARDLPSDINSLSVPLSESPFADNPGPSVDDVRAAAPEPGKSKPETELILDALERIYAGVGIGIAFVPSLAADGMIVASSATDLAESWRDLLDNDPKVRKILRKLLKSSAWGTVITAHMAVAVAIAKNHPEGLSHLVKPKRKSDDDTNTRQTA